MRIVSVVAVVAALPACAPVSRLPDPGTAALEAEAETQKRLVIQQHLADTRQLQRIAYPLLAANASLCGSRLAWGSGLAVETNQDHGRVFEAAATAAGLADELTVVALAPGSPAARAGLAEGDRIVAVAGVPLTPGRRARDEFGVLLDHADTANVALTVQRATGRRNVTLTRERVCNMPYRIAVSEAINAYADGRSLTVTTGLLRFLGNDADITVIVGHEMAHNLMGHITSGVGNPGIAALYDFFGLGAKPRGAGTDEQPPINQTFESEADYVGLYLAARAGFAIAGAPNVYRRFAVSAPASILARSSSTHPSSPARVVMLAEALREIEAKRAAGVPLVPDRD